MTDAKVKKIEVVLALPGTYKRVDVMLAMEATVADAVAASGLDRLCLKRTGQVPSAVGIYGRKVAGEHVVSEGDRVEIYRPLMMDPRERRRRRARARAKNSSPE